MPFVGRVTHGDRHAMQPTYGAVRLLTGKYRIVRQSMSQDASIRMRIRAKGVLISNNAPATPIDSYRGIDVSDISDVVAIEVSLPY